jgi:predicted dehydrogenase
MMYRVSAGLIPREHWIQDPREGGGRILGEVCHFVDLLQFFAGSDPVAVSAVCVGSRDAAAPPEDDVLIELAFADGSIGSIGYFAQGARSLPKERVEIHGAGRSAVIDNFTAVELLSARRRVRRRCAGKGQAEEVRAFLTGVREGRAPIPLGSLTATSLVTLMALESLRRGERIRLDLAALDEA